jgi:hypothetical protein
VGQVSGFLSRRVPAELTILLIREIGRAAIDVYSGRLRLADDELQAAAHAENVAAKEDLAGPVRILLAGQNADHPPRERANCRPRNFRKLFAVLRVEFSARVFAVMTSRGPEKTKSPR